MDTIPSVIWLVHTDEIMLLVYTEEITNEICRILTKYSVQ